MSDQVLVAVIAAVPTTIAALGAWWALDARRQATGANQATNAVGVNEPNLRQQVGAVRVDFETFRTTYLQDQNRIAEQHLGIQGELGRLSGAVSTLIALTERNHQ